MAVCWLALSCALAGPAAADIAATVTASGSYRSATVDSPPVITRVETTPVSPSFRLTPESAFVDEDGIDGVSTGDTAEFAVTIENTGNTVLKAILIETETDQSGRLLPALALPEGAAAPLGVGETRRVVMRQPLDRDTIEDNSALRSMITISAFGADIRVRDRTFATVDIPPLQGIEPRQISLAATVAENAIAPGDDIAVVITAFNRGGGPLVATLTAELAAGFDFVDEMVSRDGKLVVPVVDGARVMVGDVGVPPGGSATVRVPVVTTELLKSGMHPIVASISDPFTGIALAPASEVLLHVAGDGINPCAGLSILVFDDGDRDGALGAGEPGIAGVRMLPDIGLPVTTGADGRYVSPCATVSRLGGVDIELEVATETLPDNYFVTTENPLRVRVERGETADMAFGAAVARIVRVDLNAAAFTHNDAEPEADLSDDITHLVSVLGEQPSQVRLTYHSYNEAGDLPARRLEAIRRMIMRRWAAAGETYPLIVETRVAEGG